MTRNKTNHSREYKVAILTQVESGTSIAEVARQNGLLPSLIPRWRQIYKEDPEKAFSGNPYKDQARIAELERQLGRLYSENIFLK